MNSAEYQAILDVRTNNFAMSTLNANTIESESMDPESILIWIFRLMDAYGSSYKLTPKLKNQIWIWEGK